jgi:phage baseplate assembly protein W
MNKVATPEQTFLGTGWSFPPTFLRRSCTVQMISGESDVRESLWILLSTMKGERIMLPTYGCDIWRYVFQGINTTLIGQV